MANNGYSDERKAEIIEVFQKVRSVAGVARELDLAYSRRSLRRVIDDWLDSPEGRVFTGTSHVETELLPWATDAESKYIEAVNRTGSILAAAKEFRVVGTVIEKALGRLRARAAKHGYSPEHDMEQQVPSPYILKGTSTLYGKDGRVKLQWVKTKLDEDMRDALVEEAARALGETLPKLEPVTPVYQDFDPALCNFVTFTDYHMGMMSRGYETGDTDWNVSVAEEMLERAYNHLLTNAPRAEKLIINIQGDFLHYDGLSPVTPLHGHVLDADGSFRHMVRAAIRVIRRICAIGLSTHKDVTLVFAEGNHDLAGSGVWLQELFSAVYSEEPRMTVYQSAVPYYALQHGKVMLAIHHGHLKKNEQLPLLFASYFPEIWGLTKYRYAHCGHRHHAEEKEHPGMKVQQHSTLASRDAYAVRGGYVADREATLITYHSKYGHVARTIVTPEMLLAA